MQRQIKLITLVSSLIAGTAGAFAQGYDRYGNVVGVERVGSGYYGYQSATPRPMYRPGYYPGPYGAYGAFNGSNHPTPSSTQGDVGPGGNNNGTLSGYYRRW